ncbi:MAG: hypothetical protein ACOZJZ_21400 [Pseudomonadota bacterium]|jgi:hypothetical protein
MNMPLKSTQSRHDLTRELAPLIAGTEGLGIAALVNLETGKALTLGEPTKPAAGSVTGAELVLLARGVSGRASESELGQLAAACVAHGGVSTASLLLADHDLVLARIANSTEVLCLIVRHAPASVAALDSIVHARGVQSRLHAARRAAAPDTQAGPRAAQRRDGGWLARVAAWTSRFRGATAMPAEKPAEPSPNSHARPLREACEIDNRVLAADLVDLHTLAHVASFRRGGCGIPVPRSAALAQAVAATCQGRIALAPLAAQYGLATGTPGKARVQIGRQEVYLVRVPYFPALRIPFDEREVLVVAKPPRGNPALDWTAMDKAALNLLRARIGALLGSGLPTQMSPFPANQVEFQAIVDRLAALPEEDLIGRLDIGGFAPRPVEVAGIEQRCAECIYYLPHRKWCDLPELPVPVEPQWWCRLWKL